MVFASIEFLIIFLPLFFLIYALVGPAYRNGTLLICSWIFYGWWSPGFLLLFMLLALLGWIGGLAIDHTKTTKSRKWTLALFIGFNLCTLMWFKYANIFVETLSTFGFVSAEWKNIMTGDM
jgi:alginate O-acetyltransferase complex protein AlgI